MASISEVFTVVLTHQDILKSCKSYNSKCMIVSTQITNTEILTFIAVPVFK